MTERPGHDGPTVDIVVNNYEYGRFLPAAIESALAQSYEPVNVIVVDDGSGDESRQLIAGYDDRITPILKQNGGQASALNAGFEHCRGDIVIFLDADDVLRADAAELAAAAFAADPELVKVQFRMDVIDAAGIPTGVTKPAAHLAMPSGDLRRVELAQPYDLVWMSTSANAFRTEVLRQIMPIPETPFRTCADWYLVHLSTLLGPVSSLTEIGSEYRVHGANNYEPQSAEVDLDHLHETIGFAATTSAELVELAARLGLSHPTRILSIADLANRMISLRLAPEAHLIPTDSRLSLLADSVRAARRRGDATTAIKLLFVAWFATMAIAPRPLARRLAVLFLFPQARPNASRLLGRLQGGGDVGGRR